jgi:predicted nuclease of predicted toxin-antitoxin system
MAARAAGTRFLLNEMWSAEIARQLSRRGLDVVAATELPRRYRGVPDDEVFARAQVDGRTIVTDNVGDFARLVADAAGRGEPHCGVVFALRPAFDRARPGVIGEMVRGLAALARSQEAGAVVSSAVFLRPARSKG